MKNTMSFWLQQLRFAQANLNYLKYSKGHDRPKAAALLDKNSELTNATVRTGPPRSGFAGPELTLYNRMAT
jgi:hypothetical protein